MVDFTQLDVFSKESTDTMELIQAESNGNGEIQCLHCDWHGSVETDFFFRHHKMEMVRLGLGPFKSWLWADAFYCLLADLNEPRDVIMRIGIRLRFIEHLRGRVQRFDRLNESFDEEFGDGLGR